MKEKLLKSIEYLSDKYENEKEFFFHLRNLIYESEIQNSFKRETKSFEDLFFENFNNIENKTTKQHLISTGFSRLDEATGGFSLGEYIVIGSRPSMGKTQLLINITLHISQELPVFFYSFDHTDYLLMNRFISTLTNIPIQRIHQNKLSDDELSKIDSVKKDINKYKIFVNDSPNTSVSSFKEECLNQIKNNNVKVIMVDYLQLISSHRHRNHRELEVSFISRELKNIARENNVCILVTSQLSRAVEMRSGTKRPQLSDLRESGAIEQDADKVIFVHSPEKYGFIEDEDGNSLINVLELIIAKNKNGKLANVRLFKDNDFTTLQDKETYIEDFEFSQDRLKELDDEAPF